MRWTPGCVISNPIRKEDTKMSPHFRLRILMGSACLLTVGLAACASAQPTTAPTAKQEAAPAQAAAPTTAPQAAAPAAQPKAAGKVASVEPKAVTLGDYKCPKMGGTLTF